MVAWPSRTLREREAVRRLHQFLVGRHDQLAPADAFEERGDRRARTGVAAAHRERDTSAGAISPLGVPVKWNLSSSLLQLLGLERRRGPDEVHPFCAPRASVTCGAGKVPL